MKRIICIGNRYDSEDAAGPKVYDRLLRNILPGYIEVIDGGLAGIDLLRFIEGAELVVFVDSVSGFGKPNEIVILEGANVAAFAGSRYDHSSGLAYLLRILPEVCEGAIPQIILVGIEVGSYNRAIGTAASLALKIAVENGRPDTRFHSSIQEVHKVYEGE